MQRRQLLTTAGGLAGAGLLTGMAGCTGSAADDEPNSASGNADTPADTPEPTPEATATPEPTPEPTPEASPEERAVEVARDGADGQYNDGFRRVDAIEQVDGGFNADVRYDLHLSEAGKMVHGSLKEHAEHAAGTTARDTIKALAESDIEGLRAVAIYAYVPTKDGGDAVSTKIVVDLEAHADVDWSAYPWQYLREDADAYNFNSYLYE